MRSGHATTPLRVGLAQMKPRKADVQANLEHVRGLLVRHAPQLDVLLLPETCLSGYFLEGGVT